MAKKTILEQVPMVPVGKANCLACIRANLRGGDNTCPVKVLRDGPNGLMLRGTIECASFKPISAKQRDSRLGQIQGHLKHATVDQGALF